MIIRLFLDHVRQILGRRVPEDASVHHHPAGGSISDRGRRQPQPQPLGEDRLQGDGLLHGHHSHGSRPWSHSGYHVRFFMRQAAALCNK